MTGEGSTAVYLPVEGLRIPDSDGSTIQCRFIRGLKNPVPGGPDVAATGDTIVSLHVDTNPSFANAFAAQVASSAPIVRLGGVTVPQPKA